MQKFSLCLCIVLSFCSFLLFFNSSFYSWFIFPTCQVRVLDFMSAGLLLLLLLLRRTSTASSWSQWSLLDPNSKPKIRVFPAGPQLQGRDPSGPCRTQTASPRSERSAAESIGLTNWASTKHLSVGGILNSLWYCLQSGKWTRRGRERSGGKGTSSVLLSTLLLGVFGVYRQLYKPSATSPIARLTALCYLKHSLLRDRCPANSKIHFIPPGAGCWLIFDQSNRIM